MTTTDHIEWGHNCLTVGVHHGRPEAIWNLPLNYAVILFSKAQFAELVLSRIHWDALQITLHNEEYTTEWANRVRACAEARYDRTLQHTVGEIATYYKSPERASDLDRIVSLVSEDKLNAHYEPLHNHDSINMLCRILGVKASREASKDFPGT